MRQLHWSFALFLLAVWSGCGAMDAEMAGDQKNGAPRTSCYAANDCSPGYYCNELGTCVSLNPGSGEDGEPGELPPEVEIKSEPPASGLRFVYVAIPEQNMVAKIDSETLQVSAIGVGEDPGALRTVPGQDIAVLLNRGAGSASILRAQEDGNDTIVTLPTVPGLNQLKLSPDGAFAIAYFDVSLEQGALPLHPPFQEVTLLRLAPGQEQATNLAVGFRPSDVQFDAQSQQAFIITEDGLSLVDLEATATAGMVPTIPLRLDPLLEPAPAEVLVSPDGLFALVRVPGLAALRVVDLQSQQLSDLPLAGEPTDLDLTADGALVVIVVREANQILLAPLPESFADPEAMTPLSTGSYPVGQAVLTEDARYAFLFSNATAQEVLLLADLQQQNLQVLPLKKGVRSVAPAPGGQTAVILHNKVEGTPLPEEGVEGLLDKSYGYSLLDLPSRYIKLATTPADPGPLAFAPAGQSAFLLLNDPAAAVRGVESIDLQSFLIESIPLGSPPVSLGVVPATAKLYVAQSHELGRVTFIDLESLGTKTVTGFELNSYVIE